MSVHPLSGRAARKQSVDGKDDRSDGVKASYRRSVAAAVLSAAVALMALNFLFVTLWQVWDEFTVGMRILRQKSWSVVQQRRR